MSWKASAADIPYAVWNNRVPGPMRIWLPTDKVTIEKYLT